MTESFNGGRFNDYRRRMLNDTLVIEDKRDVLLSFFLSTTYFVLFTGLMSGGLKTPSINQHQTLGTDTLNL